MMPDHYYLYLLAAFVVGLSKGGLTAAGSLAVPFLSLWGDPLHVAASLLPVYIISDMIAVFIYRREYSLRHLLIMIPSGLFGVGLAWVIAPWLAQAYFILITGIIGFVHCLNHWLKRRQDVPPATQAKLAPGLIWGTITGVVSFVAHAGVPPYQAYMLKQHLPKLIYAGTTTFIFAAINLAKLPAYLNLGLMDQQSWGFSALMSFVAILGTLSGRKLALFLPERIYFQILYLLLAALSVKLCYDGIVGIWG